MKTLIKKTVYGLVDQSVKVKEGLKFGKKEVLKNENLSELIGRKVQQYLEIRQNEMSITVYEKKKDKLYSYDGERIFGTASTVKVAVLMSLVKYVENEGRDLSDEEFSKIQDMIRRSDNNATTWIWNRVGKEVVQQRFNQWGMTKTKAGEKGYWGLTETTANDQIKLLKLLLTENEWFNEEQQKFILTELESVIPEQKWGISSGVKGRVMLKNGWAPKKWNDWRINSLGCVQTESSEYIIVILSEGNPSMSYGVKKVEQIAKAIAESI